ncbi:hypothetical protein JK192_16345 [Gluconobacter cerinus]|uniref:hypothetical protein n=1 Tax=Gluconobacter cerinus TaxID=38307 RepID=UPI001B8CB1CB|nr:hypothetical protein [Gluconobacter cerinus]MBS1032922.1 hypothetical protein [Gluconobacter cerinus]
MRDSWGASFDGGWQADLERWLVPYLEGLGNKTRRKMCPAYIAGGGFEKPTGF